MTPRDILIAWALIVFGSVGIFAVLSLIEWWIKALKRWRTEDNWKRQARNFPRWSE